MHAGIAFWAILSAFPVETVSDDCLSALEAREAVTSEHLIEFSEAARLARNSAAGEVVSANLCRVNHRLVYVLAVLSREGRVARVSVDAKSRSIQNYR